MVAPYILAVDDDPEVLGTVARTLAREGFEVGRASSGAEALEMLARRRPDLIVLDIIMPGLDGLEVCRQVRADVQYNDLAILFLTARSQTQDVVAGLDAGGDDYLVKPFELAELIARVRALIRRGQRNALIESPIIRIQGMELDSDKHKVVLENGQEMPLTATEHRLLRYLMEHVDQALSPQHLLEAVWDYPSNTGDPDLVRAHVRNLRSKLKRHGKESAVIRTIHGVGYMISS